MHIKRVGSYEAKTHLPSLLDSVQEGEKIIITRNGVPVAILAPYKDEKMDTTSVVEAILEFRKGKSLQGLSITDLKNEGRKY